MKKLTQSSLDWAFGDLPHSDGREVIWLDAATGAGNLTLRLAERLKGHGQLITVDNDLESWTDWAQPKLEKAGLLDHVTFQQADLAKLKIDSQKFDGIYSHATLSAMGLSAIDALSHWTTLIKPGGKLVIQDSLPILPPKNEAEEDANFSWQLGKAIGLLRGEHYYEEFQPDFIRRRLEENGYVVHDLVTDESRPDRNQESFDEWLGMDEDIKLPDPELADALQKAFRKIKDRALERGSIPILSGSFIILATNG